MDVRYKFPKLRIDKDKYAEYGKRTFDTQLPDLPEEIQFCSKCVMPNQRPRTTFDEEGVCNACRYAEMKFGGGIDWEKREAELVELLDKHRSKDGSWDVLVPSSAGKDSALVAHQLKAKYGMHPLTATWAPFIYTDIGWQNYFNMVQTGFDGLIAWPDGLLHRKLARIAFELKGDPWEPFTYGQKAYAFNIALKFNIPLMFYGESGEIEYGGSFKNWDKSHESPEDWDELYFKGAGIDVLVEEGVKMGILTEEEIKNSSFDLYRAPSVKYVKKLNLEMHWWSYYKLWIPQENFYYAVKNTGFEASHVRTDGTYTKSFSIDDRLDPFHWYLAYIKFGYGRATREACSDVRCGHITREEAVALAQRYDHEFPKTYFKDFLDYLDITEEHFREVIDRYRLSHIWKNENGKWKRRKIVSNDSIFGEEPKEE
ncbi:MAG: N-acetyl sugar amidotransferase [Candidatus Omnitrophica bacterium]|nr:N-acetyl sugar amidotransferase [Candidatus Omnitrophota bacterium]MBU1128592.1 N-acetyl sugar amidotransferase [Candidatus Omnitrophota bacterium]MBU1784719.1 N-acetyl sugar amidotransferase [Candidatus Omnitrophota bacterium]MBU1851558.1 N-acetyl sugar amidotransferase [Candidatus Omnitrophota bacterium]